MLKLKQSIFLIKQKIDMDVFRIYLRHNYFILNI
jgi:hypothetical protein